MNYTHTRFMKSVNDLWQLPPNEGVEVAFVGRSNAGKSSALNTITHIHRLAYTSKTPGRTQLINLFEVAPSARLVDLPGYGYAKVSRHQRDSWGQLLGDYIQSRLCLQGIVLIMDIRHPMTDYDQQLLLSCQAHCRIHVLLTKADKLSRGAGLNVLLKVRSLLKTYSLKSSAQLFSSLKKQGVEEARSVLDGWFAQLQAREVG